MHTFNGLITAAMPLSRSKLSNCLHMLPAAITLVTGKTILRILFSQFYHHPVTSDLGNNRSSSYRSTQRVTVNQGNCFNTGRYDRHCIYQRHLRLNRKMFQNLSHSLLRSLINIQLVDIADTDYIYRNRQCFGKYFVIKLLALYCRKLLGIIKSADKNLLQ